MNYYDKINWKNRSEGKTTKISAERLNHMDNQIFDNANAIGNVEKIADIGDGTLCGAAESLKGTTDKLTQSLGNISKRATTIKGYINEYNDDTHSVGISHKNQKSTAIPSIVIDGKYYDLLLNNIHSDTNYKIVDTEVVIESGVWKLKIIVYIDGVYYFKYLNFDK